LAYEEDRNADVDANVVMAEPDAYVEVQGTGEHGTFPRAGLDHLLDLAGQGLTEIFAAQRRVLAR
jgi:ribonuclease PH